VEIHVHGSEYVPHTYLPYYLPCALFVITFHITRKAHNFPSDSIIGNVDGVLWCFGNRAWSAIEI
jgi:hypothetical protein